MTYTRINIENLRQDFNDSDKAAPMPAYFPRHRRTVRYRRRVAAGAVRHSAVPSVLKRLIGIFIRT